MEYYQFEMDYVLANMETGKRQVGAFLARHGLDYEPDCELTVVLRENGEIVATGSLSSNVLKCIAVEYEGMGLAARVVSELVAQAGRMGRGHLFVFTKPANRRIFEELGFYVIARSGGDAILLENRRDGVKRYLEGLEKPSFYSPPEDIGCIVANCNPFTRGHRHLIERALEECGILHLFILSEDRSAFSADVRYRLVREGIAGLDGVLLHKASDYIISFATFPTYFIKEASEAARINARLDLDVFCTHIAPYLGITKRFVGEEPLCPLTSMYNEEMAAILPRHGVQLRVIPRLATADDVVISASRARELLKEGKLEELKKIVPESTYRLLVGGAQVDSCAQ